MHYRSLILAVALASFAALGAHAQRVVGADTLYGDEWIRQRVQYVRLDVTEAGIYRVTGAQLAAAGLDGVTGAQLELVHYGREVPAAVSTEGRLTAGDFVEFAHDPSASIAYEADLYPNRSSRDMLSPSRRLFTDSVAYYVSVNPAGPRLRITEISATRADPASATREVIQTSTVVGTETFAKVISDRHGSKYSSFQLGEGWSFAAAQSRTIVVPTPGRMPGASGLARVRTLSNFTQQNGGAHTRVVSVGTREVRRDSMNNGAFSRDSFGVAAGDFGPEGLTVSVTGQQGGTDAYYIGEVSVSYPALASLTAGENIVVTVGEALARTGALSLAGAVPGQVVRVIHPRTLRVWRLPFDDSTAVLLADLNVGDRLYLAVESAIGRATARAFRPLAPHDPNTEYIVVGSRSQDGWPWDADDYAAFRQNPRHGGYASAAYRVEALYDQYNYGLRYDARAIANLASLAKRRGRGRLLLLLGKGREFTSVRTPAQRALPENATFTVPTFGTPSSDNLVVADRLTGQLALAVGRIAAETPAELEVIFRKTETADLVVVDNPQLRGLEWTKELLHIAGGLTPNEQASIQAGFRTMSGAVLPTELAPNITSIFKSSNEPIQSTDVDAIFGRINAGANTVIFFGHGSPTSFEFNINRPDRYNNTGRYPLLLAYGCYSGNCNTPIETIGEQFLSYPDKGFVAYAAGSGLNYISSITDFGVQFYRAFAQTHYDEPLGEAMRVTVNRTLANPQATYVIRQHVEQFILQGDPALMLYKLRGPDVVVDGASLRLEPTPLTQELDSFSVSIDLCNLGRGTSDGFYVTVERESERRAREIVDTLFVDGIAADRELSFAIPSWGPEGVGLNRLWFTIGGLDAQSVVSGALANDATGPLNFVVARSNIRILYPSPHEVVDTSTPTLYAEAGNLWAPARTFEWELSSDPTFADPSTLRASVLSKSLVRYTPQAPLTVAGVYHFRVRPVGDTVWATSRFRYGAAAAPASLRSFAEFAQGTRQLLEPLPDGSWRFANTGLNKTLTLRATGQAEPPTFITSFENPANSIRPWSFSDTSVTIMIADSLTGGEPAWNGALGSIRGTGTNRTLTYHVSSPEQRARVAALLDSLPSRGHFVYFWTNFSIGTEFQPDAWVGDSLITGGRSLLGVLKENGAQLVDQWVAGGTAPYAILWQQGIGVLGEELGADSTATIVLSVDLPTRSLEGSYVTPAVGPLRRVEEVQWGFDESLSHSRSTLTVEIRGTDVDGDTLVVHRSRDYRGTYSLDSARQVGLKSVFLYYATRDDSLRRPQALLHFDVAGALEPELAFDPELLQIAPSDSVGPRQAYSFGIGLRNLSPEPIQAPTRLAHETLPEGTLVTVDTLSGLPGWGTALWRDTVSWSRSGGQELSFRLVSLDPDDERGVASDVGFSRVEFGVDSEAPDVAVLIDGEPLRSRQLLAPSPVFEIVARDDLSFDSLRQESISVQLTTPDGELLAGSQLPGTLELGPSSVGGRERTWVFRPGRLSNGVYALAVSVVDDGGNRSRNASLHYEFEVDTATAISNVLPYPNPMVDAVRFQYELTGEVPTDYRIAIYSSSGRLVRSLSSTDLGPLQIGRRLTQGTWNGTDEFGQRLARGVYLYRFEVSRTSAGDAFEQRSTGAERAVESGFGKLVIVR